MPVSGIEGFRRAVSLVDNENRVVDVVFTAGLRRLAVDAIFAGAVTVDVENDKQGGDAVLVMTPALPGAGVTSVSAEIAMVVGSNNFRKGVITVFADQPFDIQVEESITTGGTFDRTAVLATGVASVMRSLDIWHGRDFVQVVITNRGAGAMTVLRVTHKVWEF